MYIHVLNRIVRNFIPAIGVAYSPCECRWEFDVALRRDNSLDMLRLSPSSLSRRSCRPFSTTRNRVLTRNVISYVPSAPMLPETRRASTMETFQQRSLQPLRRETRRYLVNHHRRNQRLKTREMCEGQKLSFRIFKCLNGWCQSFRNVKLCLQLENSHPYFYIPTVKKLMWIVAKYYFLYLLFSIFFFFFNDSSLWTCKCAIENLQ